MTTDIQTDVQIIDQPCTSTRSLRAWSILILTSAIGLFIDLWSKSYAFATVSQHPVNIHREDVIIADDLWRLIPPHEPMSVMNHVLEFTLVLNPGAVFGIGAGQRWFFVVFTVIAIIISLVLFVRWTSARDWMAHTGFGLIIAGGIGNLYDRLVYACVRDFIHPLPGVHLPFGLSWPGGNTELWPYVSNIADAFLIVGIIMLMIHAWRMPNESQEAETDQSESASTTSG